MKAYFTVEAAFLLPVTLGIYVLLIYSMFFLYDRCVFEQDIAMLAMRGAVSWEAENEEIVKEVQNQANEIDPDKFLSFQQETISAKVVFGKLTVEGNGNVNAPLGIVKKWIGKENWEIPSKYTNRILSPALILRASRKLIEKIRED